MKKLSVLPVAIAAVLLSANALAVDLNKVSHTAVYNSSNMTIGTDTLGGVTYSTVSYEGLLNGGAPGMPSLPIDYIRFSVPYNATNFTVTTTERGLMDQNLNHLVYPCQRPWFTDGPVPPIALPDTSAYYSGSSYPSQMAWVAGEGYLAGENHIVTVAVMPFRYSHSTTADVLTKITRCSVTLHFQLSDSLPMSPIVRNDSLLREEGYELTRSMVVNPNQVKSFAPVNSANPGIGDIGIIQGGISGNELNGGGITPPQPVDSLLPPPGVDTTGTSTGELLITGNYTYLIVTTPELEHAVRRIAALKQQKGYNVKVVTMNEVLSSPISGSGDVIGEGSNAYLTYTDPAGKLRQFIRNYYTYYGTKYVLLAGNIPYRYTSMTIEKNLKDTIITLPSDFYYIDINGDWYNHEYDFQPDLYLGRIIAKSSEQITNYSDKLYRYVMNPGKGDNSYLKRILYSQGYDSRQGMELYFVKKQMDSLYSNPDIISESSNINDNSKYPSGELIIDTINAKKYGFISLHHHGFPAGLATYGVRNNSVKDYLRFLWAIDTVHSFVGIPDRANDDPSTSNGLNNLTNKWYPNICYSTACTTIPFDTIPGYENIPMNFGESFTTGKDYGGPAYLGNTREGIAPFIAYLERHFAKKINEKYYHIGVANALARTLSASLPDELNLNRYSCITQNLLGDPELELWTDLPQSFSDIEVIRSDSAISISGIESDSTIVAYYSKCNNAYMYMYVTDSCVTINNASPNFPIMLYKHNYLPYLAPLLLQNISFKASNYIIANEVVAGNIIDPKRTSGNVIIPMGIEYEIEASGTVRLEDGFKVEKGATFAVYPSSF